jgi:hypothetical protein
MPLFPNFYFIIDFEINIIFGKKLYYLKKNVPKETK